MVSVNGRSRRVRRIFWGAATGLAALILPLFVNDLGKELGWWSMPESQQSRTGAKRVGHVTMVLLLPVSIVGTCLLVGWLFGRGGATLRMTAGGLCFPYLPGMKSGRDIRWEDVAGIHEVTEENVPPKGQQVMMLYDIVLGDRLTLLVETARPVAELRKRSVLGRLVLLALGSREKRRMIPLELRDNAFLEITLCGGVPKGAVLHVISRLVADPELRQRYCATPVSYTIGPEPGESAFVPGEPI